MALNLLRQKQIFDQFGQPVDDSSPDDGSPDTSDLFGDGSDSTPQIPGWAPPDINDQYGGNPSENMGGGITPQSPTPRIPPYSATADSTSPPVDYTARTLELYNKLYKPSTTATDRLNQLMNQFPDDSQYAPSFGRTLAAIGVGMGKGGLKEQTAVMDEPYASALEQWKAKAAPFQQAATLENQQNINERLVASTAATNIAAAEKIAETQRADRVKEEIAQTRADAFAFQKMHPTWTYDTSGPTMIAKDPADPTKSYDTGLKTGHLSDTDKINLEGGYKVQAANVAQAGAMARIKAAGGQIYEGPDGTPYYANPREPGKLIPVPSDATPGQTTGGGAAVVPNLPPGSTKIGNPAMNTITSTTRTMMEGANMLLPHIPDIRAEAADLDKRGLFGPIMSRVRGYAAKIGTTGSPEEIQQNMQDFADAIANDPLINSSNDTAVGEFTTDLGFLASGAGRVHGNAKGGGSIQMINYMKNLLSSDSSLDMFNGRLNSLDKFMKGYAAGPTSKPKDQSQLDNAIDKALGGTTAKGGTTTTTTTTQKNISTQMPPKPASIPDTAIAQYSPSQKAWRYSTDGGKTWIMAGGK